MNARGAIGPGAYHPRFDAGKPPQVLDSGRSGGVHEAHREGRKLSQEPVSAASPGADPSAGVRPALPVFDDPARSPDPSVCPFFRLETDDGLAAPRHQPDEANRCVAIGAPRAQSARQQELVCLRSSHADCPRYLRGALMDSEPEPVRRRAPLPRATFAALLVLVLSAGISFGFVLQRGGIDLPVVGATPGSSAVAIVATPAPTLEPTVITATPTVSPSASATPEPTSSATPEPTPTSSPSPTSVPTPAPTPTAAPVATPASGSVPSKSRLAVLTPCPNQPGCYIYTVRAGDNLFSIANWFGVPLSTIEAWNPTVQGTGLHAGQQLRIPTPTR